MKLSPAASTRTSAWPGPGAGTGISSYRSTSGPPTPCTRIAFIDTSVPLSVAVASGQGRSGEPPGVDLERPEHRPAEPLSAGSPRRSDAPAGTHEAVPLAMLEHHRHYTSPGPEHVRGVFVAAKQARLAVEPKDLLVTVGRQARGKTGAQRGLVQLGPLEVGAEQ